MHMLRKLHLRMQLLPRELEMKITKRQLRRLIAEERQKLLVEMNPVANAERSLSMYANPVVVDQLKKAIGDLLENITAEAIEDELEEDEASALAAEAMVAAVSDAFMSVGMHDQAQGLILPQAS